MMFFLVDTPTDIHIYLIYCRLFSSGVSHPILLIYDESLLKHLLLLTYLLRLVSAQALDQSLSNYKLCYSDSETVVLVSHCAVTAF